MLDWSESDKIVAEGRYHSSDPDDLVNGLRLGPNAVIVSVDIPIFPEAVLFRPPTSDMMCIGDVVNCKIAWPANKVILEKIPEESQEHFSSPSVKSLCAYDFLFIKCE